MCFCPFFTPTFCTFDPMMQISLILRGYNGKYDVGKPLAKRFNDWYVISIFVFAPPSQNTRRDRIVFTAFGKVASGGGCLILKLVS